MKFCLSLVLIITFFIPVDMIAENLIAENQTEIYKDWKLVCEEPKNGKTFCSIQQLVTDNTTDTPILLVAIGYLTGTEPTAIFTLPLGVSLKTGVQLTVDDNKPVSLTYDVCDQVGCRVSLHLDELSLARFKSGTRAILKFSANPQQGATGVPVSLSGFTAAITALQNKR